VEISEKAEIAELELLTESGNLNFLEVLFRFVFFIAIFVLALQKRN
jgi:hypothetical protein